MYVGITLNINEDGLEKNVMMLFGDSDKKSV